MHENDDIKNEKNPQVTISLTELTLMSFACRWINVHLIVYNIFSGFFIERLGILYPPSLMQNFPEISVVSDSNFLNVSRSVDINFNSHSLLYFKPR